MRLTHLSILHYKNLSAVELELSGSLNCFIGDNGMGKTNLLDAIYYLSFAKSSLMSTDQYSIEQGAPFMMIHGSYNRAGQVQQLHCSLKLGEKKRIKLNDKFYDKISDHIGFAPLVIIAPSDQELILGGSELRRKLIDSVICQADHSYLHSLIHYNQALAQRNSLLKSDKMRAEESLFDMWEEQMSLLAEQIYIKRKDSIEKFKPLLQYFYGHISGEREEVSLRYESHLNQGSLLEQLRASRVRDTYLGYTSVGIHKDDMEFLMGENLIRKVGSQGQSKSYMLALKLAQYTALKQQTEVMPLLLLDDIFDKLDAKRVTQIVKLVGSDQFGQIFITDTNREHLDSILAIQQEDYRLFKVENGVVQTLAVR